MVTENKSETLTRLALWNKSKALDPQAFIFWLDADYSYAENNFIKSVVLQMINTKADICVFNFSNEYEDPSQGINLSNRGHHYAILQRIHSKPEHVISSVDADILKLSSLGCLKCHGPSIQLPEAINVPYPDIVYMAAILQAKVITAIDPERRPYNYLRRQGSICGQRSPANFNAHVPRFGGKICHRYHR